MSYQHTEVTTPWYRRVTPVLGMTLTATLLICVFAAALSWRAHGIQEELSRAELSVQRLCGDIRYYDEVLTMSARMAAADGSPNWERRYRDADPKLTEALRQAAELVSTDGSRSAVRQIDECNNTLVDIENQVFSLVRGGKLEEATALLNGPVYTERKSSYAAGLGELQAALDTNLAERLKPIRDGAVQQVFAATAMDAEPHPQLRPPTSRRPR
jgi:hypothetical protein